MNEKDIDQLLDEILQEPVPEPNAEGKQNAINVSKSEFIKQSHQAFDRPARPIDSRENFFLRTIKSIGSAFMNFSTNKTVNIAFGTAAVAFVAISALTLLTPLQRTTPSGITEPYVGQIEREQVFNSVIEQSDTGSSDSDDTVSLQEVAVGARQETVSVKGQSSPKLNSLRVTNAPSPAQESVQTYNAGQSEAQNEVTTNILDNAVEREMTEDHFQNSEIVQEKQRSARQT